MLKTNSKKAIENMKKYIVNNFDFCNYDDGTIEEPKTFEAIAKFIYNCFLTEKRYNDGYKYYRELKETTQNVYTNIHKQTYTKKP